MPHVVLNQKINLFDFLNKFQLLFQKSLMINMPEIFVEKPGNIAVLSTVTNKKLHQVFFIQISTTNDATTIQIHSADAKSIIKTNEVKSLLVLLYCQIKKHYNDVKILRTNSNKFVGIEST